MWETKAENEGQAKRMRKGGKEGKTARKGGSGKWDVSFRIPSECRKFHSLSPINTVSSFCLLGKYRNQLEEDLYFAESKSMLRVTERSIRRVSGIKLRTLARHGIGEKNMCSE